MTLYVCPEYKKCDSLICVHRKLHVHNNQCNESGQICKKCVPFEETFDDFLKEEDFMV